MRGRICVCAPKGKSATSRGGRLSPAKSDTIDESFVSPTNVTIPAVVYAYEPCCRVEIREPAEGAGRPNNRFREIGAIGLNRVAWRCTWSEQPTHSEARRLLIVYRYAR